MQDNKAIAVTKTAERRVAADTVVISLNAVGEAKKYADAVDKAEALADATIAALGKVGINARALGTSVGTVKQERKTVGYRAVRSFKAEFAFDKKLYGAALEALGEGACDYSVSFSLKDRSAADDLLSCAVKSARAAAEVIAAAAGVKLGALIKADYSSSDAVIARPMLLRAAAYGADGGANSVEPSEIALSETVTCTFAIA